MVEWLQLIQTLVLVLGVQETRQALVVLWSTSFATCQYGCWYAR